MKIFYAIWLLPLILLSSNSIPVGSASVPRVGNDTPPTNCEIPGNPIMLLIGEDLSISMPKSYAITSADVRIACNAIAKSGRGGKVMIATVGNLDPKGYKVLDINGIPMPTSSATIIQKAQCQNEAKSAVADNEKRINKFVNECEFLFKQPRHKITDINFFLLKAKTFAEQPGSEIYQKWLIINSDGTQDKDNNGKTKERIACDNKPAKCFFYVSYWPSNEKCDASGKFSDIQEFTKYFEKSVNSKNSPSKSKSK